ncbi:hypothetical protein FF38_05255 [Lucilia cuprina]|uniref:Uncharacterized protein n=1 Tax=Lucilia cuprina TaxID=7375 RepID=A0A0L0C785_LUCCU|nr:hypothetical protein CVS40_12261 [Lucilia cuprina]KNC28106.1 hypothetical protein FF38_05255 [Lucilia cuprina]
MTESPKLKNISIRVKRTRRNTETVDEAREQVSMKRCTVRLQRYNAEELRKLAIVRSTPLTDETNKPKNIRNMVVRVRRLINADGLFLQ